MYFNLIINCRTNKLKMNERESVLNRYKEERLKLFNPSDSLSEQFFLVPVDQANLFFKQQQEYRKLLKDEVSKDISPDAQCTSTLLFKKHIDLMKNDKDLCMSNVSPILPRGQSLRASLMTEQVSTVSWLQPIINKDQLDSNFLLKEVSIPDFDKDYFEDILKDFNGVVNCTRHSLFNVTPLVFSVQTVDIPRAAYRRIVKAREKHNRVEFTFEEGRAGEVVKFPTKMVIGCRNAALVFNLGLSEMCTDRREPGRRKFMYEFSSLPEEISQFFKLLPPLYSIDAILQINAVLGILTDLYGIDGDSEDCIEFTVFELSSLAIANGCRMNNHSIYSMCAMTLGKPFPADVNKMDDTWAEELNQTQGKYLKCKFQVMFDIYTVLMGLYFRNVFPDPDIVLSVTELSQSSFTAWFSEFTAISLAGCTEPRNPETCDTRQDMLVKSGDSYRQLFSSFIDLIMDIPVANCGGARFLHHAIHCFITQYSVMSAIRLPNYSGEVPNLNKDLEDSAFTLMFKREYAKDSGEPVSYLGLTASPSCKSSLYNMNVQEADLIVLASRDNDTIHKLKEWGRLNVDKIPLLFHMIRKLPTDVLARSWLNKISLYSYLSDLYFHMMGTRITVPSLEQSLMIRKQNVQINYKNSLMKAVKVMKKREQRLDVLHHKTHSLSSGNKFGVHQRVQAVVPGDFTIENKLKNGQKKRRIKRAQVTKSRNGVPWVPRHQKVNEKRTHQLCASGYVQPKYYSEPKPSTSHASELEPNDVRHLLRRKH